MSEHAHETLQEANEMREVATRGNKIVPVAAAVFAVIAALGTLLSHHRSIAALNVKNEAILTQARATDRFNSYESKSIRYQLFQALLAAGLPSDPHERTKLQESTELLYKASLQTQNEARELELKSTELEEDAESLLKSFELLEVGTTFCQISIVIVSISVLSDKSRIFLILGALMNATGIVFLIVGLFTGH